MSASASDDAWSVDPETYGNFLIAVLDEWVSKDVGQVFVMNFEWVLNAWMGYDSPVCIFGRQCGRSIVMEHNGDVYACDHHVYPEYRIGNIVYDSPLEMISRSAAIGLGTAKETALPVQCHDCDLLVLCRGGCPKQHFMRTCDDEPGLNYLCPSYKKFSATAGGTCGFSGHAACQNKNVGITGVIIKRTPNREPMLSSGWIAE